MLIQEMCCLTQKINNGGKYLFKALKNKHLSFLKRKELVSIPTRPKRLSSGKEEEKINGSAGY